MQIVQVSPSCTPRRQLRPSYESAPPIPPFPMVVLPLENVSIQTQGRVISSLNWCLQLIPLPIIFHLLLTTVLVQALQHLWQGEAGHRLSKPLCWCLHRHRIIQDRLQGDKRRCWSLGVTHPCSNHRYIKLMGSILREISKIIMEKKFTTLKPAKPFT